MDSMKVSKVVARIIFGATVLEGIYFLRKLLGKPYALQDVFPDFTASYQGASVVFILFFFLVIFFSFLLFVYTCVFVDQNRRLAESIRAIHDHYKLDFLVIAVSIGLGLLSAHLYFQKGAVSMSIQKDFLELLSPVLYFFIICSVQFIGLILIFFSKRDHLRHPLAGPTFGVFSFFLLLWVVISYSDSGFGSSSAGTGHFRVPGYPILGYQVFFIFLGIFLGLFLWQFARKRLGSEEEFLSINSEVILVASLILGAIVAWQGVAVESNAFIDIPRPPNDEIYPALDAVIYDYSAQNLLAVGKIQSYLADDFTADVGRRPLLVVIFSQFLSICL